MEWVEGSNPTPSLYLLFVASPSTQSLHGIEHPQHPCPRSTQHCQHSCPCHIAHSSQQWHTCSHPTTWHTQCQSTKWHTCSHPTFIRHMGHSASTCLNPPCTILNLQCNQLFGFTSAIDSWGPSAPTLLLSLCYCHLSFNAIIFLIVILVQPCILQ